MSPLPCPAIPCPALVSLPALSAALKGDAAAPSAEVGGSRGGGALPQPCGPASALRPLSKVLGRVGGPCSAGGCLRGGEETGKGMRGLSGGSFGGWQQAWCWWDGNGPSRAATRRVWKRCVMKSGLAELILERD